VDPAIRPFQQVLDHVHEEIYAAVEPLRDDDLNWTHPHLSNTIGILLRHIAGSERYWIGQVVGGRTIERDRAAEFAREPLHKTPLVDGLRDAQALAGTVLAGLRAADLHDEVEVAWRGSARTFTRGRALLHSLQHTAYHCGQIQLFKKMATSP
jgi:uncharacterized damage-inducible protein DinB